VKGSDLGGIYRRRPFATSHSRVEKSNDKVRHADHFNCVIGDSSGVCGVFLRAGDEQRNHGRERFPGRAKSRRRHRSVPTRVHNGTFGELNGPRSGRRGDRKCDHAAHHGTRRLSSAQVFFGHGEFRVQGQHHAGCGDKSIAREFFSAAINGLALSGRNSERRNRGSFRGRDGGDATSIRCDGGGQPWHESEHEDGDIPPEHGGFQHVQVCSDEAA